ncbi:MAG: hypothetical protein HXY40_14220, partial [Chloroflexi bacterium]|nr:hypothetical protein [Chloroflexota bacterium]
MLSSPSMNTRWLCLALLLLLAVGPLRAQDATPAAANAVPLTYGTPVTATLDAASPNVLYTFDALRGEVITITLTINSGDLDPLLYLLDPAGTLLLGGDDSAAGRAVNIDGLRVPASGRYTLLLARFGYGLGATSGEYTLLVERIGVSSEQGST